MSYQLICNVDGDACDYIMEAHSQCEKSWIQLEGLIYGDPCIISATKFRQRTMPYFDIWLTLMPHPVAFQEHYSSDCVIKHITHRHTVKSLGTGATRIQWEKKDCSVFPNQLYTNVSDGFHRLFAISKKKIIQWLRKETSHSFMFIPVVVVYRITF